MAVTTEYTTKSWQLTYIRFIDMTQTDWGSNIECGHGEEGHLNKAKALIIYLYWKVHTYRMGGKEYPSSGFDTV